MREYLLGYLLLVFGNKAVGRSHNRLGGAVILFEFENPEIGILLLEVKYIADVGTPE